MTLTLFAYGSKVDASLKMTAAMMYVVGYIILLKRFLFMKDNCTIFINAENLDQYAYYFVIPFSPLFVEHYSLYIKASSTFLYGNRCFLK